MLVSLMLRNKANGLRLADGGRSPPYRTMNGAGCAKQSQLRCKAGMQRPRKPGKPPCETKPTDTTGSAGRVAVMAFAKTQDVASLQERITANGAGCAKQSQLRCKAGMPRPRKPDKPSCETKPTDVTGSAGGVAVMAYAETQDVASLRGTVANGAGCVKQSQFSRGSTGR